MRSYVLFVKGKNTPSYNDPLEFRADSLEEVSQIIQLMLKNGHIVSVLSEDTAATEVSEALVDAVSEKLAARAADSDFPCECKAQADGDAADPALAPES